MRNWTKDFVLWTTFSKKSYLKDFQILFQELDFQKKYSKKTTPNTGLAKVAVQCSADTFVVNQTLVLRISICGENRHLRQARERYA